MNIIVKRGNITDFHTEVDVIVNAWNRNFIPYWILLPHGVSKAIKKKAGLKPFNEVQRKGLLSLGEAVLTSAGKLNCKGIIHVAGIGMLWNSSEKAIRLSVKNALALCIKHSFTSIAVPLIVCGAGKFSEEKCMEIIYEECNAFSGDLNVIIVQYE
ncbi:macro domain-containing protein [Bacillus thuringiensis]|uniref:Appr-1-p processing protein n=1 Tax=Bacillus thuringiensis TaxID=1428 RepID=A0A9X6VC17_BACTU|nr:macro domain-containing protein [Bacillus thuringiensis]MEC3270539.1 macro domain-containing protein [Bacillus thuringiensis]PFB07574.1 Appr-1-p processing protein [Bacillus thuringiensis]